MTYQQRQFQHRHVEPSIGYRAGSVMGTVFVCSIVLSIAVVTEWMIMTAAGCHPQLIGTVIGATLVKLIDILRWRRE